MEIEVSQFASQIKSRSDPAALLIGFDGGACLLNHHGPAIFRDDLLKGSPVRESGYELQRMPDQWRDLKPPPARERFMREHTAPLESAGPDEKAVSCIAHLVAENKVRAIISTDTGKYLFRALYDCGVFMEPFSCAESAATVLTEKQGQRLLIDGGDLLIHGQLFPNMYGRPRTEMLPMREALKAYLRTYPHVYCWGWCDLNLPVDWIYPDNDRPHLTAIGRSTVRSIRLSSEFTVVRGQRDNELGATNDILYELADALKVPARPRQAARRAGRARAAAEVHQPVHYHSEQPHLLLHESTKREMFENLGSAPVSVIGIEGELVRRRCSSWLAAELRTSGRPSASFEGGGVVAVARAMTMRLGVDDAAWVIGTLFSDEDDPERWASVLIPSVRAWCADVRREQDGSRRVVFLLPRGVANWAAQAFNPELDSGVRVETYFASHFMMEDVVADWLVQNVGPLLTEDLAKGSSAMALARRMVDSAKDRYGVTDLAAAEDSGAGQAADWLHEALDLWYLEILRAERRHNGDDTMDWSQIGREDLIKLWDDLFARYSDVDESIRVDFDLGMVHPRNRGAAKHEGGAAVTEPTATDDFDLGAITLRPTSDAEGSGQ